MERRAEYEEEERKFLAEKQMQKIAEAGLKEEHKAKLAAFRAGREEERKRKEE